MSICAEISLVFVGAPGFGKTSVLASVVAQLLQEKHSSSGSFKVKLPMYAVLRSIGLTEFGCDHNRVLDSILLEIASVIDSKAAPETLDRDPHHDCVLRMSSDALNAALHRIPAPVDLGAAKGAAAGSWKQLVTTLLAVPRTKPVVVIIDNAHTIMQFQAWTRLFTTPLPPHVKVILSYTEDTGTLELLMAEISSQSIRWPIYQLSSM